MVGPLKAVRGLADVLLGRRGHDEQDPGKQLAVVPRGLLEQAVQPDLVTLTHLSVVEGEPVLPVADLQTEPGAGDVVLGQKDVQVPLLPHVGDQQAGGSLALPVHPATDEGVEEDSDPAEEGLVLHKVVLLGHLKVHPGDEAAEEGDPLHGRHQAGQLLQHAAENLALPFDVDGGEEGEGLGQDHHHFLTELLQLRVSQAGDLSGDQEGEECLGAGGGENVAQTGLVEESAGPAQAANLLKTAVVEDPLQSFAGQTSQGGHRLFLPLPLGWDRS